MAAEHFADEMTTTTLRRAIAELCDSSPYLAYPKPYVDHNPYRRPLDSIRLAKIDWERPLRSHQFHSDESLVANRLLMNIYESDSLFLPMSGLNDRLREDFHAFYSPRTRLLGEMARPPAERYILGFLEDDVRTSGAWEAKSLAAHLQQTVDEANRTVSPVLSYIESAEQRPGAAEMLITQMALDGLTEASAMSQNLGGAFGPAQSELFKIFNDEFGYGVHATKHSTLFVDLCASVRMSTEPHYYWFFYLPSSIAINNYFYSTTRNRTRFFRYIGAMAYLEATFAPWFAALAKTLRAIYGSNVDTAYCDEHAHIDKHHGRMAIHDLVLPLADAHGGFAAKEMVRGIEEIRSLGALADAELLAQLRWQPVATMAPTMAGEVIELGPAVRFETQIAARRQRVAVLRGQIQLYWLPTAAPLELTAGQGLEIPAGRLYGLRADGDAAIRVSTTEPEA